MYDTWEEMEDAEIGEVFETGFVFGVPYYILRGPCCPCVYLGVTKNHPMAGIHYDDLPIKCHGGLTYSDYGNNHPLPSTHYWFGWDYGHYGDKMFELGSNFTSPNALNSIGEGYEWTKRHVWGDVLGTAKDFVKIMRAFEIVEQ